ncbi:MAG: peptidyl-prolyl cis-trans isomerase, partial [Planctomycetota bacterium]
IVAYVDGQPIRRDAMWPALTEAAGALVLDEFVLDGALERRLDQEGLTVTAAQIDAEQALLREALADDPDQSARLLAELRERRGLGDDRFDRLLRRNAGLRMLIADDAQLAPAQLEAQARRAFAREFGPAYRVRLVTADTAAEAEALRRRVLRGESFADVAAQHSTDPSRDRGGLLSPISPADATYPQVLRDALPKLDAEHNAGLSPVLALDGGYAVVQLVGVLPAQNVAYDENRDRLLREVRHGNQRLLMEQLAGALRAETDVLITDRDLGRARSN